MTAPARISQADMERATKSVAAGLLHAKLGGEPDVIADALWSQIRPIIIASARSINTTTGPAHDAR